LVLVLQHSIENHSNLQALAFAFPLLSGGRTTSFPESLLSQKETLGMFNVRVGSKGGWGG